MKLKIFPEFHLGGFPPNQFYTQESAHDLMKPDNNNDVIIFGYSEVAGWNEAYSSAMVIADESFYNTRKTEPWGRYEKKIYNPSDEIPQILDLSCGRVLVLLCNDAFEVKFGKRSYAAELWADEDLDLIVVISYWENGIDEFLVNRGVARLARGAECDKWILSDTFNGFRDSGNIDIDYS